MKIGLALGSGSSRGWTHIGIINALAEMGIKPDVITGTSIGALVGAAYLSGNMDKLEAWARSLTRFGLARFFVINRSFNGFVNKDKFHDFLNDFVVSDEALVEDFQTCFASVATDLKTGREIWMTKGLLIEAVWASLAIPGMFPAIRHHDQWLVDGGLVNPVPVSVCRALGADVVIAVNLNGGLVGKHVGKPKEVVIQETKTDTTMVGKITDLAREYTGSVFANNKPNDESPSLFDAIAGSVNIVQDRITRSRMAGDPPDIMLSPKISHINLLEFYRAEEVINEGRLCVERMQEEITDAIRWN